MIQFKFKDESSFYKNAATVVLGEAFAQNWEYAGLALSYSRIAIYGVAFLSQLVAITDKTTVG